MHSSLVEQLREALIAADGHPEQNAEPVMRRISPLSTAESRQQIINEVLADITGLGALQRYVDDPAIHEVMVVSGRHVWVEDADGIRATEPLAPGQFDVIVERLLRRAGRRIDHISPTVETRLPSGARVCAVIPPIAVDGGVLCVRRFSDEVLPIVAFCDDAIADVLQYIVDARLNVVVSGPTSSGKTSLMASLGTLIDPRDRVVTIEDTAELRIQQPHVVRLEARPENSEHVGAIGLDHLVRTALRLRPDRLIVGEVRGDEVVDMLTALSTGHDGSWTSVHSNGVTNTMMRLETMFLRAVPNIDIMAVRHLIYGAIDVVIHLGKTNKGSRHITDIVELSKNDDQHRLIVHNGALVEQFRERQK